MNFLSSQQQGGPRKQAMGRQRINSSLEADLSERPAERSSCWNEEGKHHVFYRLFLFMHPILEFNMAIV